MIVDGITSSSAINQTCCASSSHNIPSSSSFTKIKADPSCSDESPSCHYSRDSIMQTHQKYSTMAVTNVHASKTAQTPKHGNKSISSPNFSGAISQSNYNGTGYYNTSTSVPNNQAYRDSHGPNFGSSCLGFSNTSYRPWEMYYASSNGNPGRPSSYRVPPFQVPYIPYNPRLHNMHPSSIWPYSHQGSETNTTKAFSPRRSNSNTNPYVSSSLEHYPVDRHNPRSHGERVTGAPNQHYGAFTRAVSSSFGEPNKYSSSLKSGCKFEPENTGEHKQSKQKDDESTISRTESDVTWNQLHQVASIDEEKYINHRIVHADDSPSFRDDESPKGSPFGALSLTASSLSYSSITNYNNPTSQQILSPSRNSRLDSLSTIASIQEPIQPLSTKKCERPKRSGQRNQKRDFMDGTTTRPSQKRSGNFVSNKRMNKRARVSSPNSFSEPPDPSFTFSLDSTSSFSKDEHQSLQMSCIQSGPSNSNIKSSSNTNDQFNTIQPSFSSLEMSGKDSFEGALTFDSNDGTVTPTHGATTDSCQGNKATVSLRMEKLPDARDNEPDDRKKYSGNMPSNLCNDTFKNSHSFSSSRQNGNVGVGATFTFDSNESIRTTSSLSLSNRYREELIGAVAKSSKNARGTMKQFSMSFPESRNQSFEEANLVSFTDGIRDDASSFHSMSHAMLGSSKLADDPVRYHSTKSYERFGHHTFGRNISNVRATRSIEPDKNENSGYNYQECDRSITAQRQKDRWSNFDSYDFALKSGMQYASHSGMLIKDQNTQFHMHRPPAGSYPYHPLQNIHSSVSVYSWSKDDDSRLANIMKRSKNSKDWDRVAKEFGYGKSAKECYERWTRYLKPGVRKGQWQDYEDAIVVEAVMSSSEQPFTRWSDLAQRLPGRVGKQIRDRWVNHLNPLINHMPFSRADDLLLWEGHKTYGKKWVEISIKCFDSARSENHIKNRWYSATFKKFITNEFGSDAYTIANGNDEEGQSSDEQESAGMEESEKKVIVANE